MRKWRYILLLCLIWVTSAPCAQQSLKYTDIPAVMERLFAFHIESKSLNTTIVKRSFKLYIEQFDPEKSYLLENEAMPYVSMTERKAKEILERMEKGNYSDYLAMNALIQKSIARAKNLRKYVTKELVINEEKPPDLALGMRYASDEGEIRMRQKGKMARFFAFHKTKTNLETLDRRAKVFELFEKKVQRHENNYLFLTAENERMNNERVENLMTLRILKSFAKGLDTHTSFFSPEEAFEMRMNLEKQFEGVGVVLSEGIDGIVITELLDGSPAKMCGKIEVNDVLVEIDGISTVNASFEEILEMLKKKDKEDIVLGLKRIEASNGEIYRVSLRKRPIEMKGERIQLGTEDIGIGLIGKITLSSFYESGEGVSSEKDIKEAIRKFREKGELVGLVLDLRENSGGFLSQAVKVAGLFVSNGVIVISKYGTGEMHYLRNIVTKSFYSGPLVVLTSKMSASASEIVAAALQDYGVALIVGDERTFGKGSIQYQTVTDEKADLFFKVTVGKYYTVSGKGTQIDGVLADIVVPTEYAPYKIGEKYLEYPLTADRVEAAYVDPLTDLDEKMHFLFQMRYLPYTQKVVNIWKQRLPLLRQKSAERLLNNEGFQAFLGKQEMRFAKIDSLPPNVIDEKEDVADDYQMDEAINIVKDMVLMQETLPATGS